MEHNENTRVKIPALVHFTRLGYIYLSIKQNKSSIDRNTNIFKEVFKDSINKINRLDLKDEEIEQIIQEISIALSNQDLGKAFYNILVNGINGIRLIDFNDINKNTFNMVTELTFQNGEDKFRPDIVILINGMPLSFVEVKKPNNRRGILAERDRINDRFANPKFRKFVNLLQILVFSNNGEYDKESIVPVQGAFYATTNYEKVFFNCFREEDKNINKNLKEIKEERENEILIDTNSVTLKGTPEYKTNISENTSTNRIITSLFLKERIIKLLKYGIAYIEEADKNGIIKIQKHIMRYPQFFATLAIEKKIEQKVNKGIIWHTQGSGKTALAYFNVKYLTDYFQKKGKIAKFYFIVDRIDLAVQAKQEFEARGLNVEKVNSKKDFINNIKTPGETGTNGKQTITVVNIQKFSEESVTEEEDYNIDVQRIYFLDEAHRSYKANGSFLANLIASDRNAIMIALTGTPLIGEGYNTKDIFGEYIHTYYYNKSIEDGYTLKLIREEIETTYKEKLNQALKELESIKGMLKSKDVYAHPRFVRPLTEFIVNDIKQSRKTLEDQTIGAMVVCDSSDQARTMFEELQKYEDITKVLILHNEDDKLIRKQEQKEFKNGNIDILVVYNMLLTGFDAKRLKKLYLGRIVREHNLLQALTRVNRPYKEHKYGYVVDFANIKEEFDKTNRAYFNELQRELGDEFENYNNIFRTSEEIEKELIEIKDILWEFDTDNLENFTNEINNIDKQQLYTLRKALTSYKELYNTAKMMGYKDITEKIDIGRVKILSNEVSNRINILNLTDGLMKSENVSDILNLALNKIDFNFIKISEEELIIADRFREDLEKVRVELIERNTDKKDLEYISLFEELKRIFKTKDIQELNSDEMKSVIIKLEDLYERVKLKNATNQRLITKYENDVKFMRIHKRIKDKYANMNNQGINKMLLDIKHEIDNMLIRRYKLLDNQGYFVGQVRTIIYRAMENNNIIINLEQINYITELVVEEYIEEKKLVG